MGLKNRFFTNMSEFFYHHFILKQDPFEFTLITMAHHELTI